MPRLNSRGQAAMGVGGISVSIDDRLISAPAGGAEWLTDDIMVFGGDRGDGVWRTYAYDQRTETIEKVTDTGFNFLKAKGGVWAGWNLADGVVTSTGLRFPTSGLADVGPDGAIAIKNEYHSFGPWDVIERDGTRWRLTDSDAVDIQLLGFRRAIWRVGREPRVKNLPTPNIVPDGMNWRFRATQFNGEWWICYFNESRGGLVLHPFGDAARGYIIPTGHNGFGHELIVLNGNLQVVWSHHEGEQPTVRDAEGRVVRVGDLRRSKPFDGTKLQSLVVAVPKPEGPKTKPEELQPVLERVAPNEKAVVEAVIADHPEVNTLDEEARAVIVDWTAQRLNAKAGKVVWGRKSRRKPVNGKAVKPNTDGLTFLRDDGLFEIYDVIGGGSGKATWEGFGPFKQGENGYWAPPQLGPEGNTPPPPPPPPECDECRAEVVQLHGELESSSLRIQQLHTDVTLLRAERDVIKAELDSVKDQPEPRCEVSGPGWVRRVFGISCKVIR